MRITIKQVAERSGFSVPTVSRVLSGNSKSMPPPETCERVRRAAQELGYRPNSSAQATRTGRFHSVALLLSTVTFRSNLPIDVLSGIHDALLARRQRLVVAQLPDSELTDARFAPRVLHEWAVDGLLINYSQAIPESMISRIRDHSLPVVWINSQHENDCVYPDDFGAGYMATRQLIEKGHRHILYLHYGPSSEPSIAHYSIYDRHNGYKTAMEEVGLHPRLFEEGTAITRDEAFARRKALLTGPEAPTAVFGYTYDHMLPLVHCAITLGRRVPEDLSLVSVGPNPYNDPLTGLQVATWQIPNLKIGNYAVEMLLQKIEQPGEKLPARVVPCVLAEGETCVPPGAGY